MADPIVIISNIQEDVHAIAVRDRLLARGEDVITLDPVEVPRASVAFRCGRDGLHETLRNDERIVSLLTACKSILWRRPTPLPADYPVAPEYRSIVRTEWAAYLAGLWQVVGRPQRWVSFPPHLEGAESKMLQLALASELDLAVPATLITNDVEELAKFTAALSGGFVVKKLRSHNIIKDDAESALFITRRFESAAELADANLSVCPVVVQEYIPKLFDSRIVLVGQEHCFAVKIHSQGRNDTSIDYRVIGNSLFELRHESYSPPPGVVRACRTMLRRLGLNFGAFDFGITHGGRHVFFELNPNGQWLWLQLLTNLEIAGALAELLTSPPTS